MIAHVVMWHIQNKNNKEEVSKIIKKRLEELNDLKCVVDIKVGINVNPENDMSLCLVSLFNDNNDLHEYANHPKHLAVVEYIKKVTDKRFAIDYIV